MHYLCMCYTCIIYIYMYICMYVYLDTLMYRIHMYPLCIIDPSFAPAASPDQNAISQLRVELSRAPKVHQPPIPRLVP
jgi:hypothetical protein